jgi:hypothetical protein
MKMTEEKPKPKKVRLKGFPKLISGLIDSVRDTPECKDIIKGMRTRVLFNNLEDKRFACLVTIDKNQIKVEGIRKEDKDSLTRKKLFYWGYWEFSSLETMMGAGAWKSGKWIRKMGRGTVKGASQIAMVGQVLALARPPAPPEEKK